MNIIAFLDNPHGPVKIGPAGVDLEQDENFTQIPLKDVHKFLLDISAMYESQMLTLQDKLIGVTWMEDRTVYCARRSEHDTALDAIRNIPFIIEVIRTSNDVYINSLPAASVRKIASKVYYGVSYGDIKIDYLFADQ